MFRRLFISSLFLACLLSTPVLFAQPAEQPQQDEGFGPLDISPLSGITAEPGWYSRAELVSRYAEKAGRDVSALGYYEVFGLFRLGVILQQIYFRYHRGQTHDERFRDFHLRVRGLMRAARGTAGWMGGRPRRATTSSVGPAPRARRRPTPTCR